MNRINKENNRTLKKKHLSWSQFKTYYKTYYEIKETSKHSVIGKNIKTLNKNFVLFDSKYKNIKNIKEFKRDLFH